jgi:hypothetical protein
MRRFGYPILHDAFAPEEGDCAGINRVWQQARAANPWDYALDDVREAQLLAIGERLAARREQIPVLAQRVEEAGVDAIGSLDDLVPLIFTPEAYKDYPDVLVRRGRWVQLARWLDGVSAHRMPEIDFDGVDDLDDFLVRITGAGHRVVTTSGTTGKTTMLPVSPLDVERIRESIGRAFCVMLDAEVHSANPVFYTGNRSGSYNGVITFGAMSEILSTPELTYILFDERLSVTELGRVAALNRKAGNGTATDAEIGELHEAQRAAAQRADTAMSRFVDALAGHGDVPVYLLGQPFAFYTLMTVARERRVRVSFHPGSAAIMAGGLKNKNLPAGYEDELRSFYPIRIRTGYGQTEVSALYCECDAGVWHVPPTVVPVLTDEQVRTSRNVDAGTAEGLLSHFDLGLDGRWGAITTSDWVTMNFSPCRCGLASPAVTSCRRLAASRAVSTSA